MPSPLESVCGALPSLAAPLLFALLTQACGKSSTDAPQQPLTTVVRVDVQLDGDSALVGDSVTATARGVNREGGFVALTTVVWSSADTSIESISAGGVLRARNVGSVKIDVIGDGVVGSKIVRVVPRLLVVRVVAPDTAQLVDDVPISVDVRTPTGVRLAEVAPRFALSDPSVATLNLIAVGKATLTPIAPGGVDLLAVIGKDTTRRRIVIQRTPLGSLAVSVAARVLAVGDSVPFTLTATDTLGRQIGTRGTDVGVEPVGTIFARNGYLIARGVGRVVVKAINGARIAQDTVTGQAPSEFPLDLVDGDGQKPLPYRVLQSMDRVAAKWRTVIRSAPPGEAVRLAIGECRNLVPVSQFITGVRVLIRTDSIRSTIAAIGGPCAIRANGLPLLGTVQINAYYLSTYSDRKLDDLILHEVGHVLGFGSNWDLGTLPGLVSGDSASRDPLFIGPNTLTAFTKLGGSARFTGRAVPLELRVLGHWRIPTFAGEVMSPYLTVDPQPLSSVTVAALKDMGWNVEIEAYEEYQLPSSVLSPRVASGSADARIAPAFPDLRSLAGDVLPPQLMILSGGRKVHVDAHGRPLLK